MIYTYHLSPISEEPGAERSLLAHCAAALWLCGSGGGAPDTSTGADAYTDTAADRHCVSSANTCAAIWGARTTTSGRLSSRPSGRVVMPRRVPYVCPCVCPGPSVGRPEHLAASNSTRASTKELRPTRGRANSRRSDLALLSRCVPATGAHSKSVERRRLSPLSPAALISLPAPKVAPKPLAAISAADKLAVIVATGASDTDC